jgi:hypothetical protein
MSAPVAPVADGWHPAIKTLKMTSNIVFVMFMLHLDVVVSGSGPDVLCGAESKRHDGHRGLTAARGDKT